MKGLLCQSNMYIKSYQASKFVYLTSRKGNTNGPQQGNGRNRHVTGREPSFRARSIDRKDGTHHEEQLSSNGPSVIRSSSPATGTHAGTPPLPAKKSGTGVPRGRRMARRCRAPRKMRRMGSEVQYLCNSDLSEVRVSNDREERGRFRDSPGGYHCLLLHSHPITLRGEFGGKHGKVSPPFHSIPRHFTGSCSESKPMNSYDRLLINMSAILKECRRGLELQKASANFAQQSSWTRKI